jgi:hypothetical protein
MNKLLNGVKKKRNDDQTHKAKIKGREGSWPSIWSLLCLAASWRSYHVVYGGRRGITGRDNGYSWLQTRDRASITFLSLIKKPFQHPQDGGDSPNRPRCGTFYLFKVHVRLFEMNVL